MYSSPNTFICKDLSPCTLVSRSEFLDIQADFNQVTTTELTNKINEQIVSETSTANTLFKLELFEVSDILRVYRDFYITTEVKGQVAWIQ